MKERSLIAFTILSQMAVGAFWALGAAYSWSANQIGLETARTLTLPGWLAVSLAMALAVLASLFHLGTPTNAWRAIGNLRRSWLSREIVCAIAFGGASILFAGLQWLDWGTWAVRITIALVIGLVGLALIYAMSSAYRLRTVPAWNTWVTPVSFIITTLLLGALAASALLASQFRLQGDWNRAAIRGIAISALTLLGLELVLIPLWLSQLTESHAAKSSAIRIQRKYGTVLKLRMALIIAAILVMGATILRPCVDCMPPQTLSLFLAFGLVLASEVLGRLLFYAARVRLGV